VLFLHKKAAVLPQRFLIRKEQNVINKEFSVKTYNKKTDGFKKFQSVQHTKFGIGIIQEVEQKDEDTIYITAKFKSGVKKVKADFLEKV
jgi:hypothetical protein